jgi:hypothetical protein
MQMLREIVFGPAEPAEEPDVTCASFYLLMLRRS